MVITKVSQTPKEVTFQGLLIMELLGKKDMILQNMYILMNALTARKLKKIGLLYLLHQVEAFKQEKDE